MTRLPARSGEHPQHLLVGRPRHYALRVTQRQCEVLYWLSLGLTIDVIAKQLGIKPSSVSTLRKCLYRRLDVGNVAEAVRVGFELGLLTPRPAAIARPTRYR